MNPSPLRELLHWRLDATQPNYLYPDIIYVSVYNVFLHIKKCILRKFYIVLVINLRPQSMSVWACTLKVSLLVSMDIQPKINMGIDPHIKVMMDIHSRMLEIEMKNKNNSPFIMRKVFKGAGYSITHGHDN